MKILVLLRMVPDVVEELEVAPDGASLDTEFLRLIVNESDEHALEEALILKERHSGTVTAVAIDGPSADDVLWSALARGADRVVKLTGAPEDLTTLGKAALMTGSLPALDGLMPADLVLIGCQAIDDLDGQLAPLVAHGLGLPYLGLVTGVEGSDGKVVASKEFAGGVRGGFEMDLPAVLGIQAAEKPPRYVPVAKVRAVMQSGTIEEAPGVEATIETGAPVAALAAPEVADRAEMLSTDPVEAAERIVEILSDRGLV
jgi:electron transfer flavoprotein beta subunit